MIRPYKRRPYVPLVTDFFHDHALAEAGVAAEHLYLRGLAYCAGSMSDGFIASSQMRLVAVGMRDWRRRAASLVQFGLWERVHEPDGYRVRSWLKWNPSAENISAAYEADRTRKRQYGRRSFPDGKSPESERNPTGFRRTDTDTDTDTDTESSARPSRAGRADAHATAPAPGGGGASAAAKNRKAAMSETTKVDPATCDPDGWDVPPPPDWRAPRNGATAVGAFAAVLRSLGDAGGAENG